MLGLSAPTNFQWTSQGVLGKLHRGLRMKLHRKEQLPNPRCLESERYIWYMNVYGRKFSFGWGILETILTHETVFNDFNVKQIEIYVWWDASSCAVFQAAAKGTAKAEPRHRSSMRCCDVVTEKNASPFKCLAGRRVRRRRRDSLCVANHGT